MEKTARAIIIDDKGLMTLYREKVMDGKKNIYYAIPGGHVEDDETPEEAVIRELREELNIEIEIIRLLGIEKNDGKKDDYYFYCKCLKGTPVLGGEELERNNPNNYYELDIYH